MLGRTKRVGQLMSPKAGTFGARDPQLLFHSNAQPYARRFLSERANFSNLTRIAADASEDDFFSSIHQAFRETTK